MINFYILDRMNQISLFRTNRTSTKIKIYSTITTFVVLRNMIEIYWYHLMNEVIPKYIPLHNKNIRFPVNITM